MKIISLNNRLDLQDRGDFKAKDFDFDFKPNLSLFLSCLDLDLYVYPYFNQVEVS